MYEKNVIEEKKLSYEGLVDFKELYHVIDSWLKERGYDKFEEKNIELHKPEGIEIHLLLKPWKKTTDYFKNIIKIEIIGKGLKEVEIEKDKRKVKMLRGKIYFIFDAIFVSDYEKRWHTPFKFLINVLMDKFVLRYYYRKYEKWLINDVYNLIDKIKTYLNLPRWTP